MTFRKIFLIISIIGGMALQTACGNSAAEEAVAVEQEGDSTQEAEETEEQVNSLSSEEETTEATVSKKETEKAETQETTDTKKETETKEIMSVGDHNSTDDDINSSEDNQNPAEDNDTEEENGPQIDRQDIQPYDTPATLYAQQKVNIRKGPSTDFDVLGMLNLNDAVSVVGESKSSPWKEIQYQDGTAFVHGGYLLAEPVDLEALRAQQEAARAAKAAEDAAKQQEATQPAQAQAQTTPQPNPAPQPEVPAPAGILFIGDSRTCQMKSATGGANCSWICEYGTSYDWFEQTAVPKADQLIGQGTKVVICMGVNDPNHLNSYASLVNRKAGDWNARGATVYYVSLNPVAQPYEDKTPQIDSFNASMPGMLSGVRWIDTASTIKQGGYLLVDGIHYDAMGNVNIFNLICGNL
ncbi:MAG: SGNH/GDSL hydrolase family protein [Clostridiales bacterium]|nr:SGNH/GDSL hydrolase family protein [Clostridiales bacterium]